MLSVEELEKRIKEFFKADWAKVLEVNGRPYSRFKMGYAVAVVHHNKTGEHVPILVRVNPYSGSITSVILIERPALDNIIELIREADKACDRLAKEEIEKLRAEARERFKQQLTEEEREIFERAERYAGERA